MTISESAREKIKEFEGFRAKAYRCPAGVLTIGYGHTGPDVHDGMTIDRARAEELLDKDVAQTIKAVVAMTAGVKLRQCQIDALVSLAFNIGTGALQRSTLLRRLRANPDDPAIRDEFARWKYASGQVKPGLVKRRAWEAARYFGEV